jgi:vancomycin resistance protein YoaR
MLIVQRRFRTCMIVRASRHGAGSTPLGRSMSTTAPVIEGVDTPAIVRGHARQLALAAVAGFAAVLLVAGIGLARWDASYGGRVLPGVHVGTVDLSGLDPDAAAAALGAAYGPDDGRVILRTLAGDLEIPYAAVGRRADIATMVDAALHAGRTGGLAERVLGEVGQAIRGTTISPRVTLDEDALSVRISGLLGRLDRTPVDATIAIGPAGAVTTPGRQGLRFDPSPVMAMALAELRRVDAPARSVFTVAPVPVPAKVSAEAVAIAKIRMARVLHDVVVSYGKSSWTIPAATVAQWVTFQVTAEGWVRPAVDRDRIVGDLGAIVKGVALKPVSAQFLGGKTGKVVGVVAARDGRRLDAEGTAARIRQELLTRSGGDLPAAVPAAIMPIAPELTTEEATQTAPLMAKLGTWTTWFPVSDRNYYGANIWLPALIIDGTVLAPGQSFDWWRAIGPVTPARGFGPGGVIKSDHTEPTGALGGGMCSSSTTLFNAALRAGLQMGARSNHRYYINRYPLGLDATVSKMGGASQTMSFTNDTGHPIVIRGFKIRGSNGRGYVRYEIWGIPDGRQVTISRPTVSNVRLATTRTVYVTTLPHGVRKQVEYPSNGMTVAVTRVVRASDGHVIHSETYHTRYVLWNGRIEVGL